MANLLSELERFEQEMKDLGSEPSSSLLPPAHLVARVPLPPPPPPPPARGTPSTIVNGTAMRPPPPPLPPQAASGRPMPPRPPPPLAAGSVNLLPPPPPPVTPNPSMAWLNTSATAATVVAPPVPATPASQYTYSQTPTIFTSAPATTPTSAAPASSSYFPVPFHLQQQSHTYQPTQQYQQQQQSYQQVPTQYAAAPQSQSQAQVATSQPATTGTTAQPSYQYQAVYQAAATPAAPEIFAMPQQQQAQQLFQRDAQTITPEALESVKAALASGEGENKSEARKRAIPRKAAGQVWEDPTLADWPENDHRLFCGDLGNEVNDEVLTKAFTRFTTFNMARVVRDKRTGKTKGYGFVSFANPSDLALALKEMNGKYVGNRPIKLRKSTWKERTDQEAFDKQKNSKRQKGSKKNILHKNSFGFSACTSWHVPAVIAVSVL
ncbi:RNA-binding protein 42 [Marchantia polymorpha subsp. ruderalis]